MWTIESSFHYNSRSWLTEFSCINITTFNFIVCFYQWLSKYLFFQQSTVQRTFSSVADYVCSVYELQYNTPPFIL